MAQVLHFDERSRRLADVRGRVALAAVEASVFALQRVAGLVVVESFQRRLPMDQRKIFTVMLGVAFRAVVAVRIACVQAAVLGDLLRNFSVTFSAL